MAEAALKLLVQPRPLGGIDERAGGRRQVAGGPRVDDDQPDVAEVALVAEAVGARLPIDPVGERVERLRQIRLLLTLMLEHLLPDLVLGALVGGQVAEMLIDPIRAEARDDAAVPPRCGLHLLLPVERGVPVVAHVVVVEDHGARHGRQQPAVGVVRPGQPVQVGVLLVVLQLLARRLADVAPTADELLHRLRRHVGVDLVAEQEDEIGPQGRVLAQRQGEGAHRIDAVRAVSLRVVVDARATRAPRHPQSLFAATACAIAGAGSDESGSGHAFRPFTCTSYGSVDPGVSSSSSTSA